MPSTVYNKKSHFFLVGSGVNNHLEPFEYKIFNKVLQLIQDFIVMSKNTNKAEETGTNVDLTTDSLIEKFE